MIPVRIGKYAVIRKIASGGMAEVYLCRLRGEEGFEKKVAVKVVHPRLGDSPRFRDLFAREARIAASLAHPNLIQVFDFGREGRSCFLAMEFVDGWNMAQVASHARLRSISVPLSVWRYWMEGILAGLGHLHSKGIVHRDISPSNILLSRGGVVKITDFGISRAVQGGIGASECWEGKFSYMSPEQAHGAESDSGSDLFAAAAIAAELYLPARLFDAGSVEDAFARMRAYDSIGLDFGALPVPVAEVARKGLATAREDRYLDADEFVRAVCDAVPYAPVRADLQSFWSALFPEGAGDDDTSAAGNMSLGGTDVVRESRAEYGRSNIRLLKIGVLAAAAISAAAWMAIIDDSRPASDGSRNAGAPSPDPGGISGAEPVKPPDTRTIHAGEKGYPQVAPLGHIHGNGPEKSAHSAEGASGIPLPAEGDIPAAAASNVVLLETDPPGAAVSLEDGTPLGRTPVRFYPAPMAGRKIVFSRDGYYEKIVQADVLARFSAFRLEMERQMGTIEVVQAIPWANVYEGDRYIGVTPIRRLDLPVGTHRLRFVNEPLAIESIQEINVRPGENPRLIVPLVGKGKP